MLDIPLLEHDKRYAQSTEFVEVLKKFWTEDWFDYAGEFFLHQPGHLLSETGFGHRCCIMPGVRRLAEILPLSIVTGILPEPSHRNSWLRRWPTCALGRRNKAAG